MKKIFKTKLPLMRHLWEEVRTCQKCDISRYARNKVFGDGNVASPIVLVGEAPGMDEDKIGHPFVGNAGQILRTNLLAAGLVPEELFICNIIKCHPAENLDPQPSGNRKPSAKEVENCMPFLDQQLEIIKPRIVIALGNTAAAALLKPEIKKVEVTKLFGKTFKRNGLVIAVAYHPQYLGYKAGTSEGALLEKQYIKFFKKVKAWKP